MYDVHFMYCAPGGAGSMQEIFRAGGDTKVHVTKHLPAAHVTFKLSRAGSCRRAPIETSSKSACDRTDCGG